MKNLLIGVLFLFCSIIANAQVKAEQSSSDDLTYRNGKYYQFGNVLSHQQLHNTIGDNAFQQYNKSLKLRKSGIITTSVGGGLILLSGGALLIVKEGDTGDALASGLLFPYIAGAGVVTTITGVILLCSGNKRLRNIAHTYNLNNGRQISIAPATTGLGLALKF